MSRRRNSSGSGGSDVEMVDAPVVADDNLADMFADLSVGIIDKDKLLKLYGKSDFDKELQLPFVPNAHDNILDAAFGAFFDELQDVDPQQKQIDEDKALAEKLAADQIAIEQARDQQKQIAEDKALAEKAASMELFDQAREQQQKERLEEITAPFEPIMKAMEENSREIKRHLRRGEYLDRGVSSNPNAGAVNVPGNTSPRTQPNISSKSMANTIAAQFNSLPQDKRAEAERRMRQMTTRPGTKPNRSLEEVLYDAEVLAREQATAARTKVANDPLKADKDKIRAAEALERDNMRKMATTAKEVSAHEFTNDEFTLFKENLEYRTPEDVQLALEETREHSLQLDIAIKEKRGETKVLVDNKRINDARAKHLEALLAAMRTALLPEIKNRSVAETTAIYKSVNHHWVGPSKCDYRYPTRTCGADVMPGLSKCKVHFRSNIAKRVAEEMDPKEQPSTKSQKKD